MYSDPTIHKSPGVLWFSDNLQEKAYKTREGDVKSTQKWQKIIIINTQAAHDACTAIFYGSALPIWPGKNIVIKSPLYFSKYTISNLKLCQRGWPTRCMHVSYALSSFPPSFKLSKRFINSKWILISESTQFVQRTYKWMGDVYLQDWIAQVGSARAPLLIFFIKR